MQIEICEKLLWAKLTLESFYSYVNIWMLLQIRLLSEPLVASLKLADIWFFVSMNSQMVEKIVPFSEYFIAARMSTV